jgi:Protein of unknown function (DUF2934)
MPLMSSAALIWQDISLSIQQDMTDVIGPTVSSLSVSEDGQSGMALGSGTYLNLRGAPYLVTAEHVVAEARNGIISHLPVPGGYYVALTNQFQRSVWPIDMAMTRVPSSHFAASNKQALNAQCFDDRFQPVDKEVLFFIGFPGSSASRHEPLTESRIRKSYFGQLQINALPLLVQSPPKNFSFNSPVFNSTQHFLLGYPATGISKVGGPEVDLRNPHGMSGSLIWDTKWVAAYNSGIAWSPDMARVCGLVWGSSENRDVLIATKIEHIRPILLQFLREEAAFFRWESRGCPTGSALEDWLWAEKTISTL